MRHEYQGLYKTVLWRRMRRHQLARQPLCAMCESMGRLSPATVADHVTPHRGDKALFFDAGNLQSLCAHCHNSGKQKDERHGFSCQIGVDGWPIDDGHPVNR